MLSNIWVSVRGATSSGARFWISCKIARNCGQLFGDATLPFYVYLTGSAGLFMALADSEGLWLVSPSIRRFFMIGIGGGSVTSERVKVVDYRANGEGND